MSDSTKSELADPMQDRALDARAASKPKSHWLHSSATMLSLIGREIWEYLSRIGLALRWGVMQWSSTRPGMLIRGFEIVFWPLLFITLSWMANPANPLYINEGFPWPWIGVWLIALRYGALAGSVAAMILLVCWYLLVGGEFARLYFLGGAIMTLIAGEFGTLWQSRSTRFREVLGYQDDKVERLTRRLYLLKLSHDELEYELVDRPGTLRDALVELRGKLTSETVSATGSPDRLPGSRALLQFLAQYGQLEIAAIHEYIDGPRPELLVRAEIGKPPLTDPLDPMIERAILTRQSVHLQEYLVDSTRKSSLILAAPILDAKDTPIGVLTVNRMPFLALHADNLRTIWVMLQAYTEYLRLADLARPYADMWPEAPLELQHEFAWLQRLHIDAGLSSWCVVWHVRGIQATEMIELIKQEHAGSEMCWTFRRGARVMVLSLLPFLTLQQMTAQKRRIHQALERAYGQQAAQHLVETNEIALQSREVWYHVKRLVEGDQ